MRRISILTTVFVLVLATTARSQDKPQSTITVKAVGLDCVTPLGSVTFSVQSWSFGAAQPVSAPSGGGIATGRATVSGLSVQKNFDECSPALFTGVTTGRRFQTVTLVQQEQKTTIMTVTLSDVLITKYEITGSQASRDPVEAVMFSFATICINDARSGKEECFTSESQN